MTTNRENVPATYQWEQIAGTPLSLANTSTATVALSVPEIAQDSSATVRVTVTDATGESVMLDIELDLIAFVDVSALQLEDAALAACVDDFVTSNQVRDVGDITSLDCSGGPIDSVVGIANMPNLTTVDLSGGGVSIDLDEIATLQDLENLTLGGQTFLPCDDVQVFVTSRPDVNVTGGDTCKREVTTKLFGEGFDLVQTQDRSRLIASVPDNHQLVVVDTQTLRVVELVAMPGAPYGLGMSIDGSRLFVALNRANSIAVVDLADMSYTTVDLGLASGDDRTYDVEEVAPDKLLVTSSPGSNGSAFVVLLELDQGNALTRVAGGRSVRASPIIEVDRDNQFAYVGEGFSPNSLYKLDIGQNDVPLILEDDHGDISGSDQPVLKADGSRIHLTSGQILRTGSFAEELTLTIPGTGAVGSNPDRLYVISGRFTSPMQLAAFDWDAAEPVGAMESTCGFPNAGARKLLVLDAGDTEFAWIYEDRICAVVSRDPLDLDPTPMLAMPDPRLDACARDAGMLAGVTTPVELNVLDCSAHAGVESLLGLNDFEGINDLILDGPFFDLSPLEGMFGLRNLSFINSPTLADLFVVQQLAGVDTVDVSGSPNVSCAELDILRNDGKIVTDTGCVAEQRLELGGIGTDMVVDEASDRTYVSVQSLNEIVVIETSSHTINRRIDMPGVPWGIALTLDGTELMVALADTGSIAFVDLSDDSITTTDIAATLGATQTYAVAEIAPNIVLATGGPSSSGVAWVVRLDRNTDTQTRVANDTIIRDRPDIVLDRANSFAYISEGFSPNSLYKLDISDPTVPILLEDDHGSVRGSVTSLSLNADGSLIFTGGGQRLSTDTLRATGTTTEGSSTTMTNGQLAVAMEPSFFGDNRATVRYHDIADLEILGQRYSSCPVRNPLNGPVKLIATSSELLVMSEDLVCRLPLTAP